MPVILASTSRFGLAPVLGECPTVGAGLALGGGLGWLSGLHGATCDNLLAARLITADGRSLAVDATHNPDLFWAIRGGGGNFGIASQFQYQLHPVGEALAGSFTYPVKMARDMFHAFRDLMTSAPDELQAECQLRTDYDGQFSVGFVYAGNLDKGERLLNQFRKISPPAHDSVKRRAYADLYAMGDWERSWKFQFVRATYVERISDEVIDVMVDRFAQRPPNCETVFNFDHYMHGQVCRVPEDATAFSLRKPGAVQLGFWTQWKSPTDASRCMPWVQETFRLLQPYTGGRIYANYMTTYPGPQSAKNVFGPNFERLFRLKKKYDPNNLFRLNPNIVPMRGTNA